MKFVERIIVALVQESDGPLDPKRVLEDAAEIVKMEAIRCGCLGKRKRALKLWTQYAGCIAAVAGMAAEDADGLLKELQKDVIE